MTKLQTGSSQTIVFFDGYCGLCSGVVDFLIARDSNGRLVYAPLQGETARKLLSESEIADLNIVVVFTPGNPDLKLHKSDAVLFALEKASLGLAGAAKALRIFPRVFRDLVYDFVARNRLSSLVDATLVVHHPKKNENCFCRELRFALDCKGESRSSFFEKTNSPGVDRSLGQRVFELYVS